MFSSFIFHISALMIVKRQLFYFKCIIIVFLIFLRNIRRALDDTLSLGSYLWLLIFIKYLFIFLFLDNRNWSFYFCFLSRACPTTDKSLAIFCNSWYSWFRFTFSSLRYNIRIKKQNTERLEPVISWSWNVGCTSVPLPRWSA